VKKLVVWDCYIPFPKFCQQKMKIRMHACQPFFYAKTTTKRSKVFDLPVFLHRLRGCKINLNEQNKK